MADGGRVQQGGRVPRLLRPCRCHAAALQHNRAALSGSPRNGQQGAWPGWLLPILDCSPWTVPDMRCRPPAVPRCWMRGHVPPTSTGTTSWISCPPLCGEPGRGAALHTRISSVTQLAGGAGLLVLGLQVQQACRRNRQRHACALLLPVFVPN